MNPWFYLSLAIASEIAGTVMLRSSHSFTRLWPTVFVVVSYTVSFRFLAAALTGMEVGIAYAVWSAVGTFVIAVIGVLAWNERLGAAKVAGLVLVISGVVLLNISERR